VRRSSCLAPRASRFERYRHPAAQLGIASQAGVGGGVVRLEDMGVSPDDVGAGGVGAARSLTSREKVSREALQSVLSQLGVIQRQGDRGAQLGDGADGDAVRILDSRGTQPITAGRIGKLADAL